MSTSECHGMQRDSLPGVRERRSGTIGTLGRPPPYPLAVFPLHSLSPNPQPPPGHRYRCSGGVCRIMCFAVFRSAIFRTDKPFLFFGALGWRTLCAPTEEMCGTEQGIFPCESASLTDFKIHRRRRYHNSTFHSPHSKLKIIPH